jgi:hypothetical protein
VNEPTATAPRSIIAIDSDPEFFHGLTFWGQMASAQVQDRGVLIVHDLPDGPDITLTPDDARRLRDLLNVATARGLL